ncbi:glycosyl hydrolase family 61-domain-containing protein [Trametes punicea]|nr:glycosyl hydrolase family 61-domain-containing protein [Trametes punicea]
MKTAVVLALPLLAAVPFVSAHGYVASVTIDGKSYQGNTPYSYSVQSPIRMINDVSPVKGTNNTNLSCGQGAQNAALVAAANPGSTVSFQWVSGSGGNWPHSVGPLLTYMASCGSAGCVNFNSSNAQWFKIEQVGQQSDGTWAMALLNQGFPAEVQLPSNIAPGEYLIRHEIIALQNAMSLGGVEFYPSCTQLKIGGSQTGTPDQTVSFPGAYHDSDPGLLVDVYDLKTPYVFPGPPVSNLAGKTILVSSAGETTLLSTGNGPVTMVPSAAVKLATSSHASSTVKTSSSAHTTSTSSKKTSSTAHTTSSTKKASSTTAHTTSSTKKTSSTAHSTSSTKKTSSTAHLTSTQKTSSTAHLTSTQKTSSMAHLTSTQKTSSTAHLSSTQKTSSTPHPTTAKPSSTSAHTTSAKMTSTAAAHAATPSDDGYCDYEEEEEDVVVQQPRAYSRVMRAIF